MYPARVGSKLIVLAAGCFGRAIFVKESSSNRLFGLCTYESLIIVSLGSRQQIISMSSIKVSFYQMN